MKPPRRRPAIATCALLAVACMLGAPSADAEPSAVDKETARALMKQGDTAFHRADYRGALEAYRAAHAIMGVPTTGLSLAQALERLGRLVEARDAALGVTRYEQRDDEPPPFTEARDDARRLATDLAARIPSIRLRATGLPANTQPVVQIDGKVVPPDALNTPWSVDPGTHSLRARAPGYNDVSAEVTLREREQESIDLAFRPAPKAQARPTPETGTFRLSPLVPIGLAVGAAGLGVGAVTGIVAWTKTSGIEDQCNPLCPADQRDEADSADTFATVSNVGFVIGGAGLATAVVGLLVGSRAAPGPDGAKAAKGASVRASVGPRRLIVSGSF